MNNIKGLYKMDGQENIDYVQNAMINNDIKEVVSGPDVLYIDFKNGESIIIGANKKGLLEITFYCKDE